MAPLVRATFQTEQKWLQKLTPHEDGTIAASNEEKRNE